jgi:hypothetical protein
VFLLMTDISDQSAILRSDTAAILDLDQALIPWVIKTWGSGMLAPGR